MRALRWLNTVAIALALAGCTAVALGNMAVLPRASLVSGLSTAVIGFVWAWMLRHFRRGKSSLPWFASIPLAASNAGFAVALSVFLRDEPDRWTEAVRGWLMGAIVGSVIWAPALVATMVFFGLPMHRARELARRGLAGEEDGEQLVGTLTAMLAACALLFAPLAGAEGGAVLAACSGALAFALATTATILATLRHRARARFVLSVERGEIPGYRIDYVTDGKVLVRLAPQDGAAYRVTDFAEAICELDHEGNAVAPHAVTDAR